MFLNATGLKKVKQLYYEPAILFPGIFPEEMNTCKNLYTDVPSRLISDSPKLKTTQMSMDRRVDEWTAPQSNVLIHEAEWTVNR